MIGAVRNLDAEFAKIDTHWSPRVVAQVNDQYVKLAKLKGELVWHAHDAEDELFFIVKGALSMQYEDRTVELRAGDLHLVPRGVRHNPVADEECWVMLVEPASTRHTGDEVCDKTKSIEDQIADGQPVEGA
jgi:mannose-6-phosphate isomerase-like protein (cupin superfamily)